MAKALTADEEELAGLVARAGLGVAAARTFAALARGGGHGATEIAAVTGHTRQEAGDAARDLELRGLARVERVPSGGRPAHRYHLEKGALRSLVEARRAALRAELAALDALERRA